MPRTTKSHAAARTRTTAETFVPVMKAPSALAAEAPLPQKPALHRLTPLQIALLARGQVRSYSPLDD